MSIPLRTCWLYVVIAGTLLDVHNSKTFPPSRHTPYANTVVVRNNPSIFRIAREIEEGQRDEAVVVDEVESSTDAMRPIKFLHLPPGELTKLYRASVIRFVKQQTGKGKIERIAILIVVGNGKGLLGLGEGKAADFPTALAKAFPQAVRNMDYVERFEDRTTADHKVCALDADARLGRALVIAHGAQAL